MKKTLSLLLLCLFAFISVSFGQEKFLSGYIITNDQDTIKGQIVNKTDSDLAFGVSFKNQANESEVMSYQVSDLLGFGFNNGRTFNKFKLSTPKLGANAVFAKKILTGKIDLWIWRHPGGHPDIFLQNNSNQKFAQLTEADEKRIIEDDKIYIRNDYKHIAQLKQITENEYKPSSKERELKYSEKIITEEISSINQNNGEDFSNNIYTEETKYRYDIFAGIPFKSDPNFIDFKLAVFRREIKVEKNTNFSIIRGITYYGEHRQGEYDPITEEGNNINKLNLINILPIGVHFQGKQKKVKPYIYTGFGLAIQASSDYKIVKNENMGIETSFFFYPTIYLGAGLKIKIGANYLFTEFTPSLYGSTLSLGFEF